MREAFSMLELVFVLIILGVLAAIAIPRFSVTRIDAQIVAIENDINNTISGIQREVFSQSLDPKALDTTQIFTLANLSPARWIIQGDSITLGKNGVIDSQNACVFVRYDSTQSLLSYEITQKADSTLCTRLFARHPNGGKKIPLNTSNALF